MCKTQVQKPLIKLLINSPSQHTLIFSTHLSATQRLFLLFGVFGHVSYCRFKIRACVHDRNTRYKNNLNIPAYKSASGQRTFLYRATIFWYSVPRKITESDSLPIFKRNLKEFKYCEILARVRREKILAVENKIVILPTVS